MNLERSPVFFQRHEHRFRLEPLHASARDNWTRLGVVHVSSAASSAELRSMDRIEVHRGDAWPFSPREGAAELLALGEHVARQAVSQVSAVGLDRCAIATYQYKGRDTWTGALPTYPVVHADNVSATDAVRDFAPTLHELLSTSQTMSTAGKGDAGRQEVGSAVMPRDTLICDWVSGRRRPLLGLNVWLLLQDDGDDYPLVFAELSEASLTSDERPYLSDDPDGMVGTRRLKASIGRSATYRAATGMRRGDAYVFKTWGDAAAYHAGASRASLPPPYLARRRSVEVRVVLLSERE